MSFLLCEGDAGVTGPQDAVPALRQFFKPAWDRRRMIFLPNIPGMFLLQRDVVKLMLSGENQRAGGVNEVSLGSPSKNVWVARTET